MRAVALLLAFVSSAFAYSVLVPNQSQGWTNQGGQPLSWQRVSTDSLNFTAVLDNQSISGFSPQVLAALVDGTTGQASMNPPSGGWPTGQNFRVNFVKDTNDLSTIYAQSVQFSILPSNSTSTSTVPTTTATDSGSANSPSDTDSGQIVPTGASKSGAFATYSANTVLVAVFSLIAYGLA